MSPQLPAGWLSSDGAAAYIGAASLPTLYRLVNDGQVPAYRVGRVYRFRVADLDAYLETVRVQPGELNHLLPKDWRRGGQV